MAGGAGTTAVVITSVAFASLLLLLGHFIRARVWVLRRIFVPSSLIGGMLGLMFVLVFDYGPATKGTVVHTFLHEEMLAGWSSLPELLISVVFACLFLGSPIPGVRQIWRIAGPQLAYGQILAWGQYAFPILVTAVAFVEEESFNSNPLIAPTVALGFGASSLEFPLNAILLRNLTSLACRGWTWDSGGPGPNFCRQWVSGRSITLALCCHCRIAFRPDLWHSCHQLGCRQGAPDQGAQRSWNSGV